MPGRPLRLQAGNVRKIKALLGNNETGATFQ
jgi:hypothetical protein